MLRIISLSMVLIGIIYFLPFMTGEKEMKELESVSLETLSEFNIEEITDIFHNEKISVLTNGQVEQVNIDEYLVGVVAAEMPAEFELEALKAQAVAARTYIYYKKDLMDKGLSDNVHSEAIVCDDPNHCKAYIDLENENPWGEKYDEYKEKITEAVDSTKNQIVVYDDEPIAAVFHSTSSAKTESSKDVWGGEIPYLVSVDSVGSNESPKYIEQKRVSLDEFRAKMESLDVNLPDEPTEWFKSSTRSEAGGILEVYVGGVLFKGTEIREMFSLNSTNFTVSFDDKNIIFETTGYGHGVGMSQYGANSLAKEGKTYEEILLWYYSGTKVLQKELDI